jgi:hypothetical protein
MEPRSATQKVPTQGRHVTKPLLHMASYRLTGVNEA